MSQIKSILAVLTEPESGSHCLVMALKLSRQFNCHVDGLHVYAEGKAVLPFVAETVSGAAIEKMIMAAENEARERLLQTKIMFQRITTGINQKNYPTPVIGQSISWLEESGHEDQVVGIRGCRVDLVVLRQPNSSDDKLALMTFNAALMQSGRAIIIVPQRIGKEITNEGEYQNISIFWNGSPEAARAVYNATPFLTKASRVTVLSVKEKECSAGTLDLNAYLIRHGVENISSTVISTGVRTGESLLAAATDVGTDLMVMGAYSRSRLQKMIMGSVTSYVLEHSLIPVLMSH